MKHARCPDLNDFNNSAITIIFEPDENGEISEMAAPVLVTDDAVNEATEQVFVVTLKHINSLDPSKVDLTIRPTSLCRIVDNDRMYNNTISNKVKCIQ